MAANELSPGLGHPRVIQGPTVLHPEGANNPGGRNGVLVPQLWPQEVCNRDGGSIKRQSRVLL